MALKCSILATAGTSKKRALLRSLGVQNTESSRDKKFVNITRPDQGEILVRLRRDTYRMHHASLKRLFMYMEAAFVYAIYRDIPNPPCQGIVNALWQSNVQIP